MPTNLSIFNPTNFMKAYKLCLEEPSEFYDNLHDETKTLIEWIYWKKYIGWENYKEDMFVDAQIEVYRTLIEKKLQFNPAKSLSFLHTIIERAFSVHLNKYEQVLPDYDEYTQELKLRIKEIRKRKDLGPEQINNEVNRLAEELSNYRKFKKNEMLCSLHDTYEECNTLQPAEYTYLQHKQHRGDILLDIVNKTIQKIRFQENKYRKLCIFYLFCLFFDKRRLDFKIPFQLRSILKEDTKFFLNYCRVLHFTALQEEEEANLFRPYIKPRNSGGRILKYAK